MWVIFLAKHDIFTDTLCNLHLWGSMGIVEFDKKNDISAHILIQNDAYLEEKIKTSSSVLSLHLSERM